MIKISKIKSLDIIDYILENAETELYTKSGEINLKKLERMSRMMLNLQKEELKQLRLKKKNEMESIKTEIQEVKLSKQ